MTPNGGKPPLLLETEMKNAEGVFGSRRRRPEAGGGGVGGAKAGSRLEGVLATTLRRFLRSDRWGWRAPEAAGVYPEEPGERSESGVGQRGGNGEDRRSRP